MPRAVARPQSTLPTSAAQVAPFPTTPQRSPRGHRLPGRCDLCGVTHRSSSPRRDLRGALALVALFAIVLLGSGCSASQQTFSACAGVLIAAVAVQLFVMAASRCGAEPGTALPPLREALHTSWCGCFYVGRLSEEERRVWESQHPKQLMRGVKGPKLREVCFISMKFRDVQLAPFEMPDVAITIRARDDASSRIAKVAR